MLLKNFVVAYQSLREACAISGPCTSTRTWSVFHCSPYLSQLTRCGRIQNEPSSVAWRPLSQLTHCGLKTNKPSSVPWRPLSQLTRCGRKRNKPSSVTWRPLSELTRSSLKTNELSHCCTQWSLSPLSQLTHCGLKTNKPSSVPWRPLMPCHYFQCSKCYTKSLPGFGNCI